MVTQPQKNPVPGEFGCSLPKLKQRSPLLCASPRGFTSFSPSWRARSNFQLRRQYYTPQYQYMFPKPFSKHHSPNKHYECSYGMSPQKQRYDQRSVFVKKMPKDMQRSCSSIYEKISGNFKGINNGNKDKKGNKENQFQNVFLVSQLQTSGLHGRSAFACFQNNDKTKRKTSEKTLVAWKNVNDTPIGKIHDISSESQNDSLIRTNKGEKSTVPSMTTVRERCMAPKDNKPKVSINSIKRKATANYDPKCQEIKSPKNRSHSTANIASIHQENRSIPHLSFKNTQPLIYKNNYRPGLADLCFKPTESIVAEDSDIISEVMSSRSIQSRIYEVDSEWSNTLDDLFRRRHKRVPLE